MFTVHNLSCFLLFEFIRNISKIRLLDVQGQATLKKLLPQISILLVALGGYLAADRLNAPKRVLPVTYSVTPKIKTNKDVIQSASILFVGDHHAKRLYKYNDKFRKIVVPSNVKNLKIINIATENEGIHRTFRKIKSLKNCLKSSFIWVEPASFTRKSLGSRIALVFIIILESMAILLEFL